MDDATEATNATRAAGAAPSDPAPPPSGFVANAYAGGALLLGVVPPRVTTGPERVREIAEATLARLTALDVDGLALYDIDDESDRNAAERPFPYLPTMDPVVFHERYLKAWDRPAIIYRCVGKYPDAEFRTWLGDVDTGQVHSVFVGAPSKEKEVHIRLPDAQALRRDLRPDLLLGGVAITERDEEHRRLIAKQDAGCDFFISQVVYNTGAAKSLVSDYYYSCLERGVAPRPIIFTLSVCGSLKTLDFLTWLGVDVPRWLANSLRHADDTLAESYEHCIATARDLIAFCRKLGTPFGFLVESVSIRRVEIEASAELAREVGGLLGR